MLDGLFGFAEYLGATERVMRWDIALTQADLEFAAGHIAADEPVCVISPCSSQRARNFRNWDATRYAEVVAYLHDRYGVRTILTGGPTAVEQEYGAQISAGAEATNLIGKTSLKQLLALIARARLVICPDSGPAHMATAVQTPVVGLYATSNRWRTGPYLSQDTTVDRYPDAVAREFGKPVEELRWGQRVRDPEAMNLISVADVQQQVDKIFAA